MSSLRVRRRHMNKMIIDVEPRTTSVCHWVRLWLPVNERHSWNRTALVCGVLCLICRLKMNALVCELQYCTKCSHHSFGSVHLSCIFTKLMASVSFEYIQLVRSLYVTKASRIFFNIILQRNFKLISLLSDKILFSSFSQLSKALGFWIRWIRSFANRNNCWVCKQSYELLQFTNNLKMHYNCNCIWFVHWLQSLWTFNI